ncbi:MAG: nitroreductase [Propionibacteriaceae bacterium]|nr:nitroreductase [Propionibacteriaceae bacterium]
MSEGWNQTLEVIKTRYACRDYSDRPVDREVLRLIAEAAVQAPSAMNRQPWLVVVVSDKATVDDLDGKGLAALAASDQAGYERIMGRGGKLFYDAPAMIFVAKQKVGGVFPADLDCGIVTANIVLAARSLGVDSVVCGLAGYLFDGPQADEVKKQLGFPPHFDFAISVLLGYAASGPGAPHQPDLGKIVWL